MNKARLIITAINVEKISQAEAARRYGVSSGWVSKLLNRFRVEGEAAFIPKTRRPHTSPTASPTTTVELIAEIRHTLTAAGHDAGAHTIAWHLETHHNIHLHPTTIWRHLRHLGTITPQPQKRPRSSYIRFQADLPNETWQSDFTHFRLATQGIRQKNSTPGHPTTCGKVERFQQTMKKWLRQQPPAHTLEELQHLINTFVTDYNHHRPHRSLGRHTPAEAYEALSKATPDPALLNTESRVRYDKVDGTGSISFRHAGKMHHIGIGRHYKNTRVIMLIDGLEIRVVDQQTGELLRELTLDTSRDYQPQK